MRHKIFEILSVCAKRETFRLFETGIKPKQFFKMLKQSHPFVFDRKCTDEAITLSSNYPAIEKGTDPKSVKRIREVDKELGELVKDFSLPFKNSLYILTDAPSVIAIDSVFPAIHPYGYLISEITPEKYKVSVIAEYKLPDKMREETPEAPEFLPSVDEYEFDLKNFGTNIEEILLLMRLTQMISVKRIGIELDTEPMDFKAKGAVGGSVRVKFSNLIHVADKVEYEYRKNLSDGVNWDYRGYWRGHWRAFYRKDALGNSLQDEKGWNIVDYNRTGKDRSGAYNTAGYTWVTEHTRGDPKLAEIKMRTVKHK